MIAAQESFQFCKGCAALRFYFMYQLYVQETRQAMSRVPEIREQFEEDVQNHEYLLIGNCVITFFKFIFHSTKPRIVRGHVISTCFYIIALHILLNSTRESQLQFLCLFVQFCQSKCSGCANGLSHGNFMAD